MRDGTEFSFSVPVDTVDPFVVVVVGVTILIVGQVVTGCVLWFVVVLRDVNGNRGDLVFHVGFVVAVVAIGGTDTGTCRNNCDNASAV